MATYRVEAEIEVEAATADMAGAAGFPADETPAWRPLRSTDISYRKVLPAGRRAISTFCELMVEAGTIAEAHAAAERLLAELRTRDGDRVARACVARVRPVDPVRSCAAGDPAKPRPANGTK